MLVKIGSKWHFYVHVADLFLYSAHYLTFDDSIIHFMIRLGTVEGVKAIISTQKPVWHA